MRRTISKLGVVFLLSASLTATVVFGKNHLPKVGEKLRKKGIPASAFKDLCFISADDAIPCVHPMIDGVKFLVAFDERSLRVRYIRTDDNKFRTSDGFKVGDVINVPENGLTGYNAWDIFAPKTRDGWRPIVGMDLGCGDEVLDEFFCDDSFRKSHPGKARIRGFSKGG